MAERDSPSGSDKQRDTRREKTVGVYERAKKGVPTPLLILVIIIALIFVLFMLIRFAGGGIKGMEQAPQEKVRKEMTAALRAPQSQLAP